MNREDVIQNVRACLLTSKGSVTIENLNRDYRMLIDENIPFKALGFPSLVAFLNTVPSIRVIDKGNMYYAEAIPSVESAHITKLIARQKTSSKKNKKLVRNQKPASFRQPMQRNTRNVISAGANMQSKMCLRSSSNYSYPSVATTVNVNKNNEKPRFMQTNHATPATAPSTRLKEKKMNPVPPTNQSVKDPRLDLQAKNNAKAITPVISQKPKTANNNTEVYSKKVSSINDRLKVNHTVESLIQSLRMNNPSTKQSDVLSPLSPGQLVAEHKSTHQQPLINSQPQPLMSIKPLINNTVQQTACNPQFQHRLPTNMSQFQQSTINSPQFQQSQINSTQYQRVNSTQFQPPPINATPPLMATNVQSVAPKIQCVDPREELKRRAAALNLAEPVYQMSCSKQAVYAKVKIGKNDFGSYPKEARTEDEAQKLAANIALLGLAEKYGSPYSLNETKDKDLIKKRILSVIDAHTNGIFMHQIPVYYKKEYQEILPADWTKDIEKCPEIVLEKGADNSVILRRFVSSPEKIRHLPPLKVDKIVQLNPIGIATPEKLELPNSRFFLATVNCVVSTTEIWIRIIEDSYADPFFALMNEISQYYSKVQQTTKPQAIKPGNYYAVYMDECWYRVRCVEFDATTGDVIASFIDYGDEDVFHYSKLYPLDKKFCVFPAQAVRVSLSDLEDFSEYDSIVGQMEILLLERTLHVEIISRDGEKDEPTASVIFYDTNGPEDVDINAQLLSYLLGIVVPPKLNVGEQVSKVYISHVEPNGDVYVQVQSESMKLLVSLLNRLISTKINTEDKENSIVTKISLNETYFVSVDNNWYRGKIVHVISYNELRVFLIDYGKTVTTSMTNLLDLKILSKILADYPAQAIKVHLHNIDQSMFNEKMVTKLVELVPEGELLLVKIVTTEDDTPVVEMFRRIQPSNMLVSVNNTLALEEELIKTHGDGNNNIKPRKRVERMNSKLSDNENSDDRRSLKPPKIGDIRDYFDVHVTMAAHPGNFTVQPFDHKRELESLMIRLQEACETYDGPTPGPESIQEGKLYAARHTDGHWYRVCISSIINDNMVSVYFCDYGDVSVLPLDKLQPLKSEFFDLPYQAIKARLVGIRPINGDWSVEDSYRFHELVVEKSFVSVVVESRPDEFSPAETILGLKLIDVTTNEDICIDKLLVDEGRAVFVD